MEDRIGVLFVCLGNICRSPMAEAVFRHLATDAGVAGLLQIDSAGTGDWHIGEPPQPGTLEQLALRGIAGDGMRARQVSADDLDQFHYVVAMDSSNLANLERMARRAGLDDDPSLHLSMLLDHLPQSASGRAGRRDVPDPYGTSRYGEVFELVHEGCTGLLDFILEREPLAR